MKKSCGVSQKGYFIRYGPITCTDKDPIKCFQIFWDKVWRLAGENFITIETLQCPDFKEVVESYKTFFLKSKDNHDQGKYSAGSSKHQG